MQETTPHPGTETSMDGAWSLCNSVMKLELLITGSSGLGDPTGKEAAQGRVFSWERW